MESQLLKASKNGDLETLKKLMNVEGLDWNIKDFSLYGYTALHYACLFGHLDIVQFLLTIKHVDINITDHSGNTPLSIACGNGHRDIIQFLLTIKQVDIRVKNKRGNTPFLIACVWGHLEIVDLLLTAREVDINVKNYFGHTSLRVASGWGHLDIVCLLLTIKEVDVNVKDSFGETPLHIASYCGRLEIVRFLIEEEGADYSLKNIEGNTPRDYAFKMNMKEIVKYLDEISRNSSFSISHQNQRRLQRQNKKQSRASFISQENAFDTLAIRILDTGTINGEQIQSLANYITTTQDITTLYSIAKGLMRIGRLTKHQCSEALKEMFSKVIREKIGFENDDYVSIIRLLNSVKEQNLISEDNYIRWEQEIRKINTVYFGVVKVVKNANVFEAIDRLDVKYNNLRKNFNGLYNAYVQRLQLQIILGLLRTGFNLLCIIELVPNFSELIACATDFSSPLGFCHIVCEDESIKISLENKNIHLVLKPVVKYILDKSGIQQSKFLTVAEGILGEMLEEVEGGYAQDILQSIEGLQIILENEPDEERDGNDAEDEKEENEMSIQLEATKSNYDSNQEKDKITDKGHTKKMKLKDLLKVLHGSISENDFLDDIEPNQYIEALDYSEGDLSKFKRAIKLIPSNYNVNKETTLEIKRDGSEEVMIVITAVQYAAICGYLDIMEDFFLSEDQVDNIDFGPDTPLTCLSFASKRRKFLCK